MQTNIKHSVYKEYFEKDTEKIDLLSIEDASKFWISNIDDREDNFYKLLDKNPIIKNSIHIGHWLEYYDNHNQSGLINFLHSKTSWSLDSIVFFCINKKTVIKTDYETFLKNVFSFLEVYDDCPLLVYQNINCNEFIYFAPLGNIYYSPLPHESFRVAVKKTKIKSIFTRNRSSLK
ncbi:MAG: DUF2947 family protein [Flavobacteriaceae bacterium]|jgi:hypothetical protein|nr:DUF2947 family protein [Flavobacteriaceae bacterium]